MSSFSMKARDKITLEIVDVFAFDDYFGRHKYGYKITGQEVMTEEEFFSCYDRV